MSDYRVVTSTTEIHSEVLPNQQISDSTLLAKIHTTNNITWTVRFKSPEHARSWFWLYGGRYDDPDNNIRMTDREMAIRLTLRVLRFHAVRTRALAATEELLLEEWRQMCGSE